MHKPAFIFDGRNILDHAKLRWVGGLRRRPPRSGMVCLCHARVPPAAASSHPPAASSPSPPPPSPLFREIGFIVYAVGKPLEAFLQKEY